jgi:LysM repeat protein
MTQVAEAKPPPDRPIPHRQHDICPFLLAENAWRSASPAKEHRCLAVGSDVPLSVEKQKRLCLTASHRTCPAYATALGLGRSDRPASEPGTPPRRPYPRMAPVVLDHGRIGVALPAAARDRPAGQLALGALMVVAFAAIALARLSGVGAGGLVAGAGSPTPQATLAAALPTPTPSPVTTPVPSASASPVITPAPSPTEPARTYKVKRGETLSGIAARFGTTVRILVDLNDIKNPSRIPVGAVLELPREAGQP